MMLGRVPAYGSAVAITRLAESAEERTAIQRFRYDVYVDELHRYGRRADHAERMLVDDEDEWSWLLYIAEGEDILASTRITWGGHGFSERQIDQYRLAPFLEELPHGVLAVGERVMVRADKRGSELAGQLRAAIQPIQREHGVRAVFGAFEPHLVSMYIAQTLQRPYANRNINHADAGYLVPMLSLIDGPEALTGLGREPGLPQCIEATMASNGTIRSPLLEEPATYASYVDRALEGLTVVAFEGVAVAERARCTAGSFTIRCFEGDRVVTSGGTARNLYIVLRGELIIGRDNPRQVIPLMPGDVIGEDSFLSKGLRTYNADVVGAEAELLSLSDRALRALKDDAPTAAATLSANLTRISERRRSIQAR